MFTSLGTKLALRKAGLGNVSLPKSDSFFGGGNTKNNNAEDTGVPNPFANVQWGVPKAFASWTTPPPSQKPVRKPPQIGERAQTNPKLVFPTKDGRPCVILFLRFCGCPCEYFPPMTTSWHVSPNTNIPQLLRNSSSNCAPSRTATAQFTLSQSHIAHKLRPTTGSRSSAGPGTSM
jgi:hypothetical protein